MAVFIFFTWRDLNKNKSTVYHIVTGSLCASQKTPLNILYPRHLASLKNICDLFWAFGSSRRQSLPPTLSHSSPNRPCQPKQSSSGWNVLLNLLRDPADPDPGGLDGAWVSVFLTSSQVMPWCWSRGQGSRSIHLKCCESPAGLVRKAESHPLPTLCPDLLTQNQSLPDAQVVADMLSLGTTSWDIYFLQAGAPSTLPEEGQVLSLGSLAYELGYSFSPFR